MTPSLSSSKGSLFITSTPISETDLFYQLWNGAKTKIDEKGLDIPYDYMLKINGELYRDFHLFKTKDEAIDLLSCVNCFLKECFDCQRNETKQKLVDAVASNMRK